MITGENKWGILSTKITSCGVTVNHTSPIRVRPFSQGPSTLGSVGKSSSNGLSISTSQSAPSACKITFPSTTQRLRNSQHRLSLKIKGYMKTVAHRLPSPAKCTIEERRTKKFAKLHFACQQRSQHCLYSKTFFSMRTRNAKIWIHLDLQSRSDHALSSYDSSVSSLKHCWDTLKFENKTFTTLVTSAFPPAREQDALINELRNSGFFDVFEIGPMSKSSNSLESDDARWGCFL